MAAIARLALTRQGFDVVVVGDGSEAIASVERRRPDAVLLDWMMPVLDGPATCARLKADAATAAIPVIFLTGKASAADVTRMRELGAAGHIPKPFDPLALGRLVEHLIGPV